MVDSYTLGKVRLSFTVIWRNNVAVTLIMGPLEYTCAQNIVFDFRQTKQLSVQKVKLCDQKMLLEITINRKSFKTCDGT
jgi:hypothetical protein